MKFSKLLVALGLIAQTFFAGHAAAHDMTWEWSAGGSNATLSGFQVYRKKASETNYTLIATTEAAARSYSDPDRTVGNCYALTVYNAFGASSSVTACALGPDGSITLLLLR